MNFILKGAEVFSGGGFIRADIAVSDGKITAVKENLPPGREEQADIIDCTGMHIFPGFIDVHTHMREPGFEYKETIETGTLAAAHGGYTHICAMPNLNPVPDSRGSLALQLERIEKSAHIHVYPYAAITVGEKGEELSDMEGLSENAIAFSDDGRGVQSEEMMLLAMERAKSLGKLIAAHCEDNSLLRGGYIHDGDYARLHGHRGICSESEWRPIERDIALAKKSGCAYHVCHVSAKESVELIRRAKAEGVDITCETAPHYLVMNDSGLKEEGRFKMNPPIRAEEDRLALLAAVKDGTVDMIATDHAPHSLEEKSRGLEKSLMGVVGLETAFAVLYTRLVKTGEITLAGLIELLHGNAARRFGIGSEIAPGEEANFTVFNLGEEYTVNTDEFLSKGRSTPFEGERVFGKCKLTICKGEIAWKENMTEN